MQVNQIRVVCEQKEEDFYRTQALGVESNLLCNPRCVFERGEVNRAVPTIARMCEPPGFLSAVFFFSDVCEWRRGGIMLCTVL